MIRPEDPRAEVGLCFGCRHARSQENARGSRFWRCLRADREPDFLRYPPLPVLECSGFEPANDPDAPR